ncbi:MAG: leucine-rich repeat protein [Bacteroidaceae bacterium]|nr:leucine-rich repeat protein [Bacteroidaceae bacterium]
MKKIFQYILMAVAVVATASCSNDIDETLQPAGNGAIQFVVSDFPAFGESGLTRAIGTQDEGKTAWENGDQIIVTLTSQKYGEQAAALTYDGSSWSTEASLSYLENETPTVSVIYAPCYEITEEGVMQLRSGMQLGMTECLSGNYEMGDGIMTITFEDAIRDYSRLRIAAMPEATLTVSTEGFTPAGATSEATEAYPLTADNKGNAYLYGTFAEGATVSVKQGDITLKDYTFSAEKNPNGTEYNKSYALDARPVIDGTLGGKTEATEEELAAMVELLKSYIENGLTTIIVTGSQPALLLKEGYLIPVVSLAFEQLTYAYQDEKIDSYWGAVDLIYQDVTEIVEYEFYVCDVLKSITLPKVTTVGDRGFWACYYLETLTFGSVVTAINDNSGEVFYDLGYQIGGCHLVLNKDQGNVEGLAPDLANNTWAGYTWKSITLK